MKSFVEQDQVRQHVWALVRLFDRREYRDQFTQGYIRFNTLGAYRRLEDAGVGRADPWEGFTASYPPKGIRFSFGGHELRPENLISPIRFHRDQTDGWNVCSFIALHYPAYRPVEEKEIPEIRKQFLLTDRDRQFGNYVAIVNDANDLLQAVQQRLSKEGMRVRHGLVSYFEEEETIGMLPRTGVGFFKRKDDYVHQREFRIVVERDNPKDEVHERIEDTSTPPTATR